MAYKILIIDDDKDLSFIISETLKKYIEYKLMNWMNEK